jgi:hypothetical protein
LAAAGDFYSKVPVFIASIIKIHLRVATGTLLVVGGRRRVKLVPVAKNNWKRIGNHEK